MAAIVQTTFSNAFSWMKMFQLRLQFHWSLFLRVQLTIFQHWLFGSDNGLAPSRQQAIIRPGNKPLSEPMMVSWLTHICVTRPQWVKELILYVRRPQLSPFLGAYTEATYKKGERKRKNHIQASHHMESLAGIAQLFGVYLCALFCILLQFYVPFYVN